MNEQIRICTRCVMDTTAKNITFDTNGYCSYCRTFENRLNTNIDISSEQNEKNLQHLISKIQKQNPRNKYDCIVGVSGGVDSSWVLVKAVKLGLRPLAVHMDNGWNSELAQNNISNLISELGVDLYTYVIDWEEYRNLMQSFFDSDVIDIELLYDNAMLAICYKLAKKNRTRYILSGSNTATEGMVIPPAWTWYKYDVKSIKSLGKMFGKVKLKTFPTYSTLNFLVDRYIRKIQWVPFLDYFQYNKEETLSVLEKSYEYTRYPYKHYESIFTRFYQGFILPTKFGVDKRKVHLSTLIMTNQLSREEALTDLKRIPYASVDALEEDKLYFLKKMGWTQSDLESYLARPEKSHKEFPTEVHFAELLKNINSRISRTSRQTTQATGEIDS